MTTVMSPIEFDHLVQVIRHRALGYRAECWCGWAGPWCDGYDTADELAQDHRKVAARPATALAATLGGLLDLQDDLADTVMWLAENWSSDLPVPNAGPQTKRLDNGECVACLGLHIYCSTGDELVALADLLAAPVVADTQPDTDGQCYQRATRMFGRVYIEAHTDAAQTEGGSP